MEVCLDLGMDILWLSCEGLGLRTDYLEGDISGDDVVLHIGGWPEVVMEQGPRKPFAHYAIRETLWRFRPENSSVRFVVAGHSLGGSTWTSPFCLSPHTGIWSASQDIPKQSNSGSIASVVVATASSPATVGAQLVFNGMPSRYIIIILNFAYSVDVVPTFSASESYIVQKVFVRLLVENQVHLASIRDSAELRPLPWPSFSSYAVSVHLTVPWSPRVWACSSALMISSPALFGALLVAVSDSGLTRGIDGACYRLLDYQQGSAVQY
jgi:hypothetical protein